MKPKKKDGNERPKPRLTSGQPSTIVDGVDNVTSIPSPDDPAEALAAVVALRAMADRLERRAVRAALDQGWSWSEIAEALGVSKQAAHKRLAGSLSKKNQ